MLLNYTVEYFLLFNLNYRIISNTEQILFSNLFFFNKRLQIFKKLLILTLISPIRIQLQWR